MVYTQALPQVMRGKPGMCAGPHSMDCTRPKVFRALQRRRATTMPTPLTPKRQFPDLTSPSSSSTGQGNNKSAAPAEPEPTLPPVPTVTGFFRAPLGPGSGSTDVPTLPPISKPPLGPLGAVRPVESGHFLQRVKLFSALSFAHCQHVVKRMRRRDFPPNTTIVREGAPGSSMFFIISGHV